MKKAFAISLITILFSCKGKQVSVNDRNEFDTAFNQKAWLNGNEYLHGRMAKDIIKRNILMGLPIQNLNSILGMPTESNKSFYNYLISAEDTSISNNKLLLHVEIDSINNKVKDYWLTD